MKVRIETPKLTSFTEVVYPIVIQVGDKRNDENDQLVALCFRPVDAKRIKRALETIERGGK